MRARVCVAAVGLLGLFACAEAEPERHIYDLGETGVLVIRNRSHEHMAIGGCNPSFYEERLPGRWVLDPLLRPACIFHTEPDGSHELQHHRIIPPRSRVRVSFPTDWVAGTPAVMRVRHRVSTGCRPPDEEGAPIHCSGTAGLVTDPILIVEPGTADVIGRR